MKAWLFRLTVVLLVALSAPASLSIGNAGIRNPVALAPSTVPQSSITSGLVPTPDPFASGGNLLVTGNVRRGMHFRGNVPYQSPTSFTSSLGSSTLSSFLRDTAGPEDIGTRSAGYGVQPYYSATETVATTRPGRPEVVSSAGAMMSTRMQQDARSAGVGVPELDASLAEPMSFTRGTPTMDLGQGPQPQYHLFQESHLEPQAGSARDVSVIRGDARDLTSGQEPIRREGGSSPIERLFNRNERAERGAQLASGGLGPERRQSLPRTEGTLAYSNREGNIENLAAKSPTQRPAASISEVRQSVATDFGITDSAQFPPLQDGSNLLKGNDWPSMREELKTGNDKLLSAASGESTKSGTLSTQAGSGDTSATEESLSSRGSFGRSQRDALEQLRQQLDVLTRSVEARLQGAPGDTGAAAKPQAGRLGLQPYRSGAIDTTGLDATGTGDASQLYSRQRISVGYGYKNFGGAGGSADSQDATSALEELGPMSRAEIATEARRVMGLHTSADSLADAKFNEHIRAAQEHLQAGRYYQAADSFSLAAVYRPDHPEVLAGKSHALFAAGEYMSSALFLSRTLAAYPEYVRVDVDLTALVGGQAKIAGRLADIEQWYARSGSGQLQFLLSYVYFRMGRLTEAKRAVEAAYQKTPQSPAVQTMRMAIDGAVR